MNTAVISECADGVKLEFVLRAAVENTRVPQSRRVARRAGGRAVKTRIPDPFDGVAGLNRNAGRRKLIASGADMDVKALRLRISRAEKNGRGNQAEDGRERFHKVYLILTGNVTDR